MHNAKPDAKAAGGPAVRGSAPSDLQESEGFGGFGFRA